MFAAADLYSGLNAIEQFMNTMAVVVPLVFWVLFLSNLRSPEPKTRWFVILLFLHLSPLILAVLEATEYVALQFFRFGLFGWLALIIGIPHYFYDEGKRRVPRILITLGAIAINIGLYWWITSETGKSFKL